jgi:nucleotide-binding universal stress UspA family protein
MEFRRILVPFDFSETAAHAARYARDLAAHSGGEVTALHVLPPLRYEFAMMEPAGGREHEPNGRRVEKAREAMMAALAGMAGPMPCEVREGDAADQILEAAQEGEYDALVMSTRGSGAFRRWFMIGSVTSKVLHASERPVVTSVHFEAQPSGASVGRVLCAVDLGPQSARVLCQAVQAARFFDAKLAVAHAAPSLGHAGDRAEEERWRGATAQRLSERMEELKRSLGVEAESLIEFEHPARAISDLARVWKADLAVLGRGASQDLLGRLRANAYDIIRQCPCPVISV